MEINVNKINLEKLSVSELVIIRDNFYSSYFYPIEQEKILPYLSILEDEIIKKTRALVPEIFPDFPLNFIRNEYL